MFLSFRRKHRCGICNRSLIQLAALPTISPASPESLYETRSVMGIASPALYVGHSGERATCFCVYLGHTDIGVLSSISSVLSQAATIHQLLVNC